MNPGSQTPATDFFNGLLVLTHSKCAEQAPCRPEQAFATRSLMVSRSRPGSGCAFSEGSRRHLRPRDSSQTLIFERVDDGHFPAYALDTPKERVYTSVH
jgi:hypothetical protein